MIPDAQSLPFSPRPSRSWYPLKALLPTASEDADAFFFTGVWLELFRFSSTHLVGQFLPPELDLPPGSPPLLCSPPFAWITRHSYPPPLPLPWDHKSLPCLAIENPTPSSRLPGEFFPSRSVLLGASRPLYPLITLSAQQTFPPFFFLTTPVFPVMLALDEHSPSGDELLPPFVRVTPHPSRRQDRWLRISPLLVADRVLTPGRRELPLLRISYRPWLFFSKTR